MVDLILLAGTPWFFVRLAVRFFRVDTLLSDASLNWTRLCKELMGRGRWGWGLDREEMRHPLALYFVTVSPKPVPVAVIVRAGSSTT